MNKVYMTGIKRNSKFKAATVVTLDGRRGTVGGTQERLQGKCLGARSIKRKSHPVEEGL